MRALLVVLSALAALVIAFYVWFFARRSAARRRTRAFDESAWQDVEARLGQHKRMNRLYARTGPQWELYGQLTLSDRYLVFQPADTTRLLVIPLADLKCALLKSPFFAVAPVGGADSIAFNVNVPGQSYEVDNLLWRPFWRDLLDLTRDHVSWTQTLEEYETKCRTLGVGPT